MATQQLVRMKWVFLAVLCILALALLAGIFIALSKDSKSKKQPSATNYAECLTAPGAKIVEGPPKQCISGGNTYANPEQPVTSLPATPSNEDDLLKAAYFAKNTNCSEAKGSVFIIKKMTVNGWAEANVACEQGGGHIEVWKKVDQTWVYVTGFQEGPFCAMVIDKQISNVLYPTCITTEAGPTSTPDANGNPTIPNQIP